MDVMVGLTILNLFGSLDTEDKEMTEPYGIMPLLHYLTQ